MKDFFSNEIIISCFLAYFIAQSLKILIALVRDHKFLPGLFFDSGGMPSSHSSTVMALVVTVGYMEGVASVSFGIAAVFAAITMSDAAGVRRAAGEQAKVLNEIVDLLEHRRAVPGEKLKELLGHTPVQVIAGAALGFLVAVLVHWLV